VKWNISVASGIEIKRDFESSGERNQKNVQITKFKFSNQVYKGRDI